jgi:putative transposase
VNDDFNRESVAIEVDTSLRSERLVRVFERLKAERGLPDMLRVDNGPEFMGQVFVDWCQANGVIIIHRTRQAEPECVYRTLQPQSAQRSTQSVSVP